jgi:sulfur-oxidizing protein SoxB
MAMFAITRSQYRCQFPYLLLVILLQSLATWITPAESAELTLIHMGDVHGHLVPRPTVRGETTAKTEGGLARMYTKIKEIRARRTRERTLLINTGDTIQGSAEALFTSGQALVDVINHFGIDAYAPGNWDWVYGVDRALELFAGEQAKAPWYALAANAYYEGEPYAVQAGQRVLPPYLIRDIDGIKVGILGFTTDRGPQVVGRGVTKGVRFTKGDAELKEFVKVLREREQVALVVMISELGLSNNIRLAEAVPGVDVILSSDMHEITRKPVITSTKTLIAEVGQDGQFVGELNLTVDDGRIANWTWTLHHIDDRIRPDAEIAKLVTDVRRPFLAGPQFKQHVNPFNGATLTRPLDTVVGRTSVALHRMNFADHAPAAVIEGTSHIFLTDAFRHEAQADIAAIRGFRYGTVVRPGPITLEDLYHFIPIGPMIAKGNIKGKQLKTQIENSIDGSLNPDVSKWTGGWLFNYSGVRAEIDPYARAGERAKTILVDRGGKGWKPLDPDADYTYASYYYARDPDLINATPAEVISVLKDERGRELDAVEVVTRYLARLPNRTIAPKTGGFKLINPMPAASFGSPEIQPWRGAVQVPEPTPMAGPDVQPGRRSRAALDVQPGRRSRRATLASNAVAAPKHQNRDNGVKITMPASTPEGNRDGWFMAW